MSIDNPIETAGSAPTVAATTAVLSWPHRRGGTARCLIQLRTLDTTDNRAQQQAQTVVVASELRDNPRGREITSDLAGLARTAHAHLIAPACPPQTVSWYVHHGQFSTYDDSGPETFTEVTLDWDGRRYVDAAAERLLTREEGAELVRRLHLEPVEQLLDSWVWAALATADAEVPTPRR